MSGLVGVLLMSALLGAASFGIGVLPLSFSFSKAALARLSAVGTGLLLGAALGIIIPEGVETLVEGNSASEFPASAIALSLLVGFTFMLVVEQVLSPHSYDDQSHLVLSTAQPGDASLDGASVEFDVELNAIERSEGIPDGSAHTAAGSSRPTAHRQPSSSSESRTRAYPVTLGLVMHALADGLALGSSSLSSSSLEPTTQESVIPSGLSVVVFLALVIHKAPTALALTTSLLSSSLPRADCKKHLALFSASTPAGAIASYVLLTLVGARSEGKWPGVALLVSGGTFLYVATVLRPVSGHGRAGAEEIGARARVCCTVLGMFVPVAIGAIVGHDHGHGA